MKLKYSHCDETQPEMVTKLKNSNCEGEKKFNKSNCDKTQIVRKLKN